MRIGLAQISCSVAGVAANCRKFAAYARRAQERGCHVLVFPEMSDTGYVTSLVPGCASSWTGRPMRTLQECASRHSLYILCGMSERTDAGIYNALAVVSPAGALVGGYRKTHLFTPAPADEGRFFLAGSAFATTSIGEFTWGLSICYDLRFPELYRALAVRGVEVFVNCAAWPAQRPTPWEVLTRARAIENQAYVVAVNRVGTDGETSFCGRSCIVDPYGEFVCQADTEETLLVGEITKGSIASARQGIPALRGRRPELYRELSSPPDEQMPSTPAR